MPIIIWGSRGLTRQLDSGSFYCPNCDRTAEYLLKQVRPWFTLYFIPVFPVGSAERFVECQRCGGTFREQVLDMEPPSESDRFVRRLYNDLLTGSSVESVRDDLVKMGMGRHEAESLVRRLTEGEEVWSCRDCGDHYLKVVKRCTRCRD